MIKGKNINPYVIYIFLIITPIIDILNGIDYYILDINSFFSPGQIIRFILIVVIFYLFIRQKRKNITLALFISILFVVQQLTYTYFGIHNYLQEVLFISKILFNLFAMIFLINYMETEDIDDSKLVNSIIIGCCIISGTIVMTKILGIGSSSYINAGHKGLFMGLNDVTAVIVMSVSFVLYKLLNSDKKIYYLISYITIVISAILLGTKTALVGIVGISAYYLFFFVDKKYKKNVYIITGVLIILGIIFAIILTAVGYKSAILSRQLYFFRKLDFFSYIVSGRNQLAGVGFRFWWSKWYYVFIGTGFTEGAKWIGRYFLKHGMIELDLLDILYFYGIFMLLIILKVMLPIIAKSCVRFFTKISAFQRTVYLSLLVGFAVSTLGGHVLLSPLSGPFFVVIIAYSNRVIKMGRAEKKLICMIGPDRELKGGIATVISQYSSSNLSSLYNLIIIPSYSDNKLKAFVLSLFRYVFLMLSKNVHLIHIHTASRGSFLRKSIFMIITPQSIPIVLHVHGGGFLEFYRKSPKLVRIITRALVRKASCIIVLSDKFRNEFIETFCIQSVKVVKIPNGIILNNKDMAIENKKNQILYLGKLNNNKGIYDLLKILPKVHESCPEAKVIIAGNGDVDKVKNIVERNNLSQSVFVIGWIDGKEKVKYLRESSILVVPSHFEAFGISIIEAMSYGLAIVANRVGGIPEIVENNKNGILVEKGDLAAMLLSIEYLLKNKEKTVEMGNRNINEVKKYNVKNIIKEIEKVYKSNFK